MTYKMLVTYVGGSYRQICNLDKKMVDNIQASVNSAIEVITLNAEDRKTNIQFMKRNILSIEYTETEWEHYILI